MVEEEEDTPWPEAEAEDTPLEEEEVQCPPSDTVTHRSITCTHAL